MEQIEEQLSIIKKLIGDDHKIVIKEDGFLSRGYVVDNGKLVFKFPREESVKYDMEIENLNFINSLNLGVNLQSVAYTSPDGKYLGIYGVKGSSLEEVSLNNEQLNKIGMQLGNFLRSLHRVTGYDGHPCILKDEIESWQNRVIAIDGFIAKTFSKQEQTQIKNLMFDYLPKKLGKLGENLVFSHGDLGDGNVFVDKQGKVGVIDFNSSGLLDEAGDFMDIKSNEVCNAMLDAYGADKVLREKVKIRRDIRPLIVLKSYLARNDVKVVNKLVNKIRKTLIQYKDLI